MAWLRVQLTEEQQRIVDEERSSHPNPRIREKMLVLWLLHCGLTREKTSQVAGLGLQQAKHILHMDQAGGIVQGFGKDRQARMFGFAEQGDEFGQGHGFVGRDDFGPRRIWRLCSGQDLHEAGIARQIARPVAAVARRHQHHRKCESHTLAGRDRQCIARPGNEHGDLLCIPRDGHRPAGGALS